MDQPLRRLALTAAALLILGVGLLVWPHLSHHTDHRVPPHHTAPAAAASPQPRNRATTSTAAVPPAVQQAQDRAARRFAAAFTRPLVHRQWMHGLKPLVSAQLLAGFAYTSTNQQPIGDLRRVSVVEASTSTAQFRADYVGGLQIVGHVRAPTRDSSRWVVTDVEPVNPAEPTRLSGRG